MYDIIANTLLYTIILLAIFITHLLLFSSPIMAIITCYYFFRKMDYYSKEGHAKAIYLIFFNFLTIIYTFIGTFLYAFKYPFNGMPNKLDEFQHEIAPAILGISILISFAIVLLYIIISFVAFIKNKKAKK